MAGGTKRLAAAILVVAVLGAGCQTLTGRSAGQWVDDRTVSAKVKTRLAAAAAANLTRIHVDTVDGIVYMTGAVETPDAKRQAERIARGVPGVRLVVNNIHVPDGNALVADAGNGVPAASPVTEARERDGREHAALLRAGLRRMALETGTPAWTRYAGYDDDGRRVATVFVVGAAELEARGVGDLETQEVVERIAIYPEVETRRYYVVLWHTPDAGL